MFQTKVVKKTETHILCSATFPEKRAVRKTMWQKHSRDRQATDDNTIRRMRFAC